VSDLFTAPVPDCYRDDPSCNGACVQQACIDKGLFDGKVLHRETFRGEEGVLNRAQSVALGRAGRWPQIDTLSRELRHRKRKTDAAGAEAPEGRKHYADRLLLHGWQIIAGNGAVLAVRV
jgi:hypothetical protein